MKHQTLPVKRKPVSKGMFRRLSAVTRNRKQRVAASATAPLPETEMDEGGSKVSRALTIIFLIHIVAIGLIFIHQKFLDGRPSETAEAAKTTEAAPVVEKPKENLPRLTGGEKIHVVRAGDNYARIAEAEGVDEGDLRLLNQHVEMRTGLILKIPPQRIVAGESPEMEETRRQLPSDADRGLVENVDVSNAPKAQLIRPNVNHAENAPRPAADVIPASVPAVSGKSYVVQPGDSVWRIANRFKVNQDALMRANGISDARKMKTGMKLVIPQS